MWRGCGRPVWPHALEKQRVAFEEVIPSDAAHQLQQLLQTHLHRDLSRHRQTARRTAARAPQAGEVRCDRVGRSAHAALGAQLCAERRRASSQRGVGGGAADRGGEA